MLGCLRIVAVNATGQAWLSGVWMSLTGENVGWYGSKNISSGWIYGERLSTSTYAIRAIEI